MGRGWDSEEVNRPTTIEALDVQRHLSFMCSTLRVSRVGTLRPDVSVFDVMEAGRCDIHHTAVVHHTDGPGTSRVSSKHKLQWIAED